MQRTNSSRTGDGGGGGGCIAHTDRDADTQTQTQRQRERRTERQTQTRDRYRKTETKTDTQRHTDNTPYVGQFRQRVQLRWVAEIACHRPHSGHNLWQNVSGLWHTWRGWQDASERLHGAPGRVNGCLTPSVCGGAEVVVRLPGLAGQVGGGRSGGMRLQFGGCLVLKFCPGGRRVVTQRVCNATPTQREPHASAQGAAATAAAASVYLQQRRATRAATRRRRAWRQGCGARSAGRGGAPMTEPPECPQTVKNQGTG